MDNTIEFQLVLKDMMSQHMAQAAMKAKKSMSSITQAAEKAATTSNSAFGKMARNIKKSYEESKYLTNSVAELEMKLRQVNEVRFGTVLKSEFRSANREAKKLERNISRLKRGVSGRGLMGKVGGWRSSLTSQLPGGQFLMNPLTMAAGVLAGGGAAVKSAAEFQQKRIHIQALAGKQYGSKMIGGLMGLATHTIMGKAVFDAAPQMLAGSLDKSHVINDMKMLGDISGGKMDKFKHLAYMFGEISDEGKLMGKQLQYMAVDGFNPLIYLSKMTGQSLSHLRKRMKAGKISIADVEAAMKYATGPGGKFYHLLKKMGETPLGKFEIFENNLWHLGVKIGDILLPVAEKLLDLVMKFGHFLKNHFSHALKAVVVITAALAAGLLAAAAAQWVVNIAFWTCPIFWIIAGIVALVAALMYLQHKYSGFGRLWSDTWNQMKYVFAAFKDNVMLMWHGIVDGIMIGVDYILIAWYKLQDSLHSGHQYTAKIKAEHSDISKRNHELSSDVVKDIHDTYMAGKYGVKMYADLFKFHKRKHPKTFAQTKDNLLKKLGVTQPKGSSGAGGEASAISSGITSGGPRSITVNVNKEMIGKLSINSMNVKEGVGDMEALIEQALRRVLHSAAAAA